MSYNKKDAQAFVQWFRDSTPYIHAHRGKTFVIVFGGEAIASGAFESLVHDFALLNSLGIKLVLVPGARPQIETRLKKGKGKIEYVNGLRVTDTQGMDCVKEAVGAIRVEIEALLSMGIANSPMAGARMEVASGNFVTARPLGVRSGIDYQHTGEVRRIDDNAIRRRLDEHAIVLLSPIGYSPTGEVFNISADEIGTAAAIQLGADKLIFLTEQKAIAGPQRKTLAQLSPKEVDALISKRKTLPEETVRALEACSRACRNQVRRAHILSRAQEGALLMELFTRDGSGTMVSQEPYEGLRSATIDDVGGLLQLIAPLEQDGTLVMRSRELLETEIDHFKVIERDGMIIACAAIYPWPEKSCAELGCLVVHPDYRGDGRANALLEHVEQRIQKLGLTSLFILTTRTAHWFRERGFKTMDLAKLPGKRQALYNYQRGSKAYVKQLG